MLLFQIERFLVVVDAGVAVRAFILDEVYACIFVILVVLAVFVLVILIVVEVMMTAAAIVILLVVGKENLFDVAQIGIQLVDVLLRLVLAGFHRVHRVGHFFHSLEHSGNQLALGILFLFQTHAFSHALEEGDLLGNFAHDDPPLHLFRDSSLAGCPTYARSMYSPVRVSMRIFSPWLMKIGTATT